MSSPLPAAVSLDQGSLVLRVGGSGVWGLGGRARHRQERRGWGGGERSLGYRHPCGHRLPSSLPSGAAAGAAPKPCVPSRESPSLEATTPFQKPCLANTSPDPLVFPLPPAALLSCPQGPTGHGLWPLGWRGEAVSSQGPSEVRMASRAQAAAATQLPGPGGPAQLSPGAWAAARSPPPGAHLLCPLAPQVPPATRWAP